MKNCATLILIGLKLMITFARIHPNSKLNQIRILPKEKPFSKNPSGERMSDAKSRAIMSTCNGPSVPLSSTSVANPAIVQSPNFPNNYPLKTWCVYDLAVPANRQVQIEIKALDLDCPYDYVQFGTSKQSNLLSLCPVEDVKQNYYISPISTSYTFRVIFYSGLYVQAKGFQIKIYLDPITTTTKTPIKSSTTKAPVTTPKICRCGVWNNRKETEDNDERIINGIESAPHALPYQASIWLTSVKSPFCGGIIISPDYILTAAHCVRNKAATNLKVAVNDVNYINNDGEIFINVQSYTMHPGYNSSNQDNDFALVKLATSAPISRTVGIACLPPTTTQTFAGVSMTISGWGYTNPNGPPLSPNLRQATVIGLTNSACSATGYGSLITSNMICASTSKVDTDSCQGDSGGPMAATVNGKVTVVGVTSFGSGCAKPPFPGVYARVSAQKNWILANSNAGNCQN